MSTPSSKEVLRGTLIGSVALVMWASLAIFTVVTGDIPPFQLVASSFAIAFLMGLSKWLVKGENPITFLRQPLGAWALGITGLFGYHFLLFFALKNAPAVEANLINYLWPLLIVLFSAFLPGEKLRWYHVAGTLSGLAGTLLLITGGDGLDLESEYFLGYMAAVGCGLTWSSYSVLNRRYAQVPSDAVAGFCLAAGLLALACHLSFEQTVWPQGGLQWLAVIALGVGPAGGAFFFWDYGVKHGNIRVLGAGSYTIPLTSTLLLVMLGPDQMTWLIAAACVLILGGALLASKEFLKQL
ncbi:MAG: DMT family transporter [Alphaproteobacteria bacterium]|nr:DMT family transporter [Rhodospirillales bacterium]MCW9045521.1 DMT family transporter [Alphaproteobacteria bacterium]